MAESKGSQLLERLAEVLANMTGVRPWGGEYPTDPVVQHHYEAPRSFDIFLRIRLLEASGSTARITSINQPDNVTHEFHARIEAILTGNAEQAPQGWIQRVKDDLLTTVCRHFSLGGLCSGFGDVITFSTSEDEGEFGQQVTLTMTVVYRFRESKEVA
jgi:hypothetical protein